MKLLPPALEALKAQKVHTFLKGAEVFQDPRTALRWPGDQPIRKTLLDGRSEARWRALPEPLPDPSHLRVNDADGGRACDVGCEANGPQGLGVYGPHLLLAGFPMMHQKRATLQLLSGHSLVTVPPQVADSV